MERRIAVIGYSFRLPETTQNSFWQDLTDGKDLVTEVEPGRWSFENHFHPNKKHTGTSYVFKAGTLGDISQFDAEFFGISPREAAEIDPQQRHLLEMSWEAIEHSGNKPSSFRGSNTGVYLGIASLDYSLRLIDDLGSINASTATGNTSSIASNRISYTFNLKGPSLSIDTACSSSLVAFHQACQAIKNGEVDSAITGGIHLHLHPFGFIIFSKATMLSPDGRCKVFDESANGYVRSEGGGVFLLKALDKAIEDGDPIHAVVAASAVNTDGYKSGITIPSCKAQQELMEQAYSQAGISADEVDYIEAHGTGTPVGDPIETRAIGRAIGQKRTTPVPIGSVKSNLGHLEPASGVAGLVKSLLILKHRAIPPTISMVNPNPDIKFEEWNIRVPTELEAIDNDSQLTIGVNSFGFGGANAHVVLQSFDNEQEDSKDDILQAEQELPLIISGKTPEALIANANVLRDFLSSDSECSFYDVAWNYAFKKDRLSETLIIKASDTPQALEQLGALNSETISSFVTGKGLTHCKGAVFVYTGNGCQWETMGKSLLNTSPVFRQAVERVDQLFKAYADFSLIDELQGLNGPDRFEFTEKAQPALFALQVGVTEYLKEKKIIPVAVTGHSVGEVAAAWACGALSLEDAVSVIYHRSHYQGQTKSAGAMTAAGIGADEAKELISQLSLDEICIAGTNSHRGVTLAGNPDQLSILEAQLESNKALNVRLPLDYAFHSPAMDTVKEHLLESLTHIKPRPARLPFYSTVTGQPLDGETLSADYWWDNIREPVQFKHSIDALLQNEHNFFIEVGAHPILKSYLQDAARDNNQEAVIVPTIQRDDDRISLLDQCVTAAHLAGAVDLSDWFPIQGRRVELPAYAWQKEAFWHKPSSESLQQLNRFSVHPLLGSAVPKQSLQWESLLDTGNHPWLIDHQVGESIVFPGAGFIEVAVNAADHFKDNDTIEVEDIEIPAALTLEEQSSKVMLTTVLPNGNISVRSRAAYSDIQWTLNCRAKAVHQTTGTALFASCCPDELDRSPDFDAQLHIAKTKKAGLQYGPAFSLVSHGWLEGNSLTAVLTSPPDDDIDISDFYLHPGVLDSAIQLIIHFIKKDNGVAFVPVRLGKISVDPNAGKQPTFCKVRLLRQSQQTLLCNIELFTDTGEVVAVLEELRYKAVRLYKSSNQGLAFLDYQLTASPDTASELDYRDALTLAITSADHTQDPHSLRYQDEVSPLLESLITEAMSEALANIYTEYPDLNTSTIDTLNVEDPHRASLRLHFLKYAEHTGLIKKVENRYSLLAEPDTSISSELIWNTLLREYPDFYSSTHLAGRASLHLSNAFLGKTEEMPKLYNSDIYSRFVRDRLLPANNGAFVSLSHVIADIIGQLKIGERLAVMEAACLTPFNLHTLCQSIDFHKADYTFACLESDSIEHLKNIEEEYPLAKAGYIDTLETDHPELTRRHQVAIVTLDSHSPEENIQLIKGVTSMLADNATVLFTGITPTYWLNLAFGLQETWWHNGQAPQLSAEMWKNELSELGFDTIKNLTDQETDCGYFILCADWSAPISLPEESEDNAVEEPQEASGTWALIDHPNNSDILKAIESAPVNLLVLDSSDIESCLSALSGAEIQKVIISHQTASQDGLPVYHNQVERCHLATQVINALEASNPSAELFIITDSVSVAYSDHQQDVDPPQDAALWGFTRSMMNEVLSNNVRLIDLPNPLTAPALAALMVELMSPSAEEELFLSAEGQRLSPRLRLQSLVESDKSVNDSEYTTSLGFFLPGQLKQLRWISKPSSPLKDDELEIEVKATGLNFRDVMYALGLLSDEAVENGFAGASMGLEFSGKVLKAGPHVTNFKAGDNVVGFGSECFSNKVKTISHSVAHIPVGMSYESAATIPTTFLTVYYALHHLARIQKGDRVLIHGAAGGVGIAAIQVAQRFGADIYATVGSDEKRDFLKLLGVENIYNSRELTFADDILSSTPDGRGVDIVLNSLAGEAINQNLKVLKPFGRFLELGKRDFYENTHIGLRPFRNNISYFGIDADQLQKEQPELSARLFREMMDLFSSEDFYPLPFTKFDAHNVIDAFRFMQQAKQIGKVVVTYENGIIPDSVQSPEVETKRHLTLDPNGTYMVTGGLGGFGLRTAQWLIQKGAKHLLLLSRRGAASEEAVDFIKLSEETGVNIYAHSCDISDEAAVHEQIQLCGNQLPELKGIIHAATVINDSLIRNLNKEQIEISLSAKMQGADILDRQTRSMGLDFFVLFSSATTMLGNPGQAAYVAANHWLEGLAATRKAKGLAATCIRWGAIDDVGFLARNTDVKDALQNRMGGNALDSKVALDTLEQVLLADVCNIGVMELEWPALSRFLPTSGHAKFSEISKVCGDGNNPDEHSLDLKKLMRDLSPTEFRQTILDILKHELSEILLISESRIDPDKSIYDMGMDSLMGVELMAALESKLGLHIPVMSLADTPKLSQLTDKIISLVNDGEVAEGETNQEKPDALTSQVQAVAAQHGQETDVREVESFTEVLSENLDEGSK